MKKYLFSLLSVILLSVSISYSQDTLVKNKIYQSLYSYKYKNPEYVSYKLYHGGGDCNRSQFQFHVDSVIKKTATLRDYSHSGFDMGHLCNAEDFAYDCSLMGLTFKFYNCMPQYPNLNRGVWKSYETKIRKLSETDSLLIICGGLYKDSIGSKMTNTNVYIPYICWKVVKSLSTNKIIYCLVFTNNEQTNSVKDYPLARLIKLLPYTIPIGTVK